MMYKCSKCGKMFLEDFSVCSDCGGLLEEVYSDGALISDRPYPNDKPLKKKMDKKKKITLVGIVAAVVVLLIVAFMVLSPKDLVINQGETIEINVGDTLELDINGDDLEASDYQNIEWISGNDDVIKINNGKVEAFYDKDSFNSIADDSYGDDGTRCSYTTYVDACVEKGLKKWKGTVPVVVLLEPVEFESGKIIKSPADARSSYIEITASDDAHTYFYFKSKTKEANDMSFIVRKGTTVKVYVPCDTYEFYEASGNTWYGVEALFGPQTMYTKDEGETKFTYDTYWTLELDAVDGNVNTESIDYDDFPEL